MTSKNVIDFLDDLRLQGDERYQLVKDLRDIVLSLGEVVTDEVKYGGLLFSVTQPFCGIFSYADHVSLEFSRGATLPDAQQILEGKGKLRRHIKFRQCQEISAKQAEIYIAEAFRQALEL